MDKIVFSLCGLWFWLTRRRRVRAYSRAAATLELAHAYLLRDFTSHASTRDRGLLLPQQSEALSVLLHHAVTTYLTAIRFNSLRECCRYVGQELGAATTAPQHSPALAPARAPRLVPAFRRRATARVRFAVPGAGLVPAFTRFLRAENSGAFWDRAISIWPVRRPRPVLVSASSDQQLPLKAA